MLNESITNTSSLTTEVLNRSFGNISDLSPSGGTGSQTGQLTSMSIAQTVLASVAIMSNLIFLWVASVEPQLRKRVAYVFLRHISLSYLILASILVTFRVSNMIAAREGWRMTGYLCSGLLAMAFTCVGNAVTGLLFMAIYMLIVMKNIRKTHGPVSFRFAWTLVVISWIFWIGHNVAGMFIRPDPNESFRPPVCFFGSGFYNGTYVIVTCVLLLATYITAAAVQMAVPFMLKENTKKHQNQNIDISPKGNPKSDDIQMEENTTQERSGVSGKVAGSQAQRLMIHRRLAATREMLILSAMLLTLYTISWCPYLITLLIFMTCPGRCGFGFSVPVNAAVTITFSAVLGVFAFTLKDKGFRHVLCKTFCPKKTALVGSETSTTRVM